MLSAFPEARTREARPKTNRVSADAVLRQALETGRPGAGFRSGSGPSSVWVVEYTLPSGAVVQTERGTQTPDPAYPQRATKVTLPGGAEISARWADEGVTFDLPCELSAL